MLHYNEILPTCLHVHPKPHSCSRQSLSCQHRTKEIIVITECKFNGGLHMNRRWAAAARFPAVLIDRFYCKSTLICIRHTTLESRRKRTGLFRCKTGDIAFVSSESNLAVVKAHEENAQTKSLSVAVGLTTCQLVWLGHKVMCAWWALIQKMLMHEVQLRVGVCRDIHICIHIEDVAVGGVQVGFIILHFSSGGVFQINL